MQLYLKILFLVNEMQFDSPRGALSSCVERMAQARLPFSFDGAALMKVTGNIMWIAHLLGALDPLGISA